MATIKIKGLDSEVRALMGRSEKSNARQLTASLVRTADALDTAVMLGRRLDGGLVVFPLSQVSHITTHHKPQEVDGKSDDNPSSFPAVIHLKSGDFYAMAESFAVWLKRYDGVINNEYVPFAQAAREMEKSFAS